MSNGDDNKPSIQARLMQYFEKRPGQNIYITELADDLRETPTSIKNGISNLRQRKEWKEAVEIIIQGSAWRYRPPGRSEGGTSGTGRCFEQIGSTREGDLILQSDDGGIYRAVEL